MNRHLDDLHAFGPYCDHDSRHVIEHAIETLATLRGLDPDHPAERLHLLVCLTRQTHALIIPTMLDADSLGYHLHELFTILDLA